jgi:hypothetical protein
MESQIFTKGDLMISLRNINTVLVFNPETLKIKFISTGKFLRQHDPDFIKGDKISVFDNRNLSPSTRPIPKSSRILEIDALTGDSTVALQGNEKTAFFTRIMGVHQRLKNGNILVTSSDEGRVLEYNQKGDIVWAYDNIDSKNNKYRVFAAKVLPPSMDESFFENAKLKCASN